MLRVRIYVILYSQMRARARICMRLRACMFVHMAALVGCLVGWLGTVAEQGFAPRHGTVHFIYIF